MNPPLEEWIYESPDSGETIYKRRIGENEKELVSSPDLDLFTFYEFKDMMEKSKSVSSLKKALDNLRLVYYTVKDGK
jgi:hypothetical protein